MNDFVEPSVTSGAVGNCPESGVGSCDRCNASRWYGYAGGLIMTRDLPNKVWTTYQLPNVTNPILNTDDAGAGWAGGAEITLGYRLLANAGFRSRTGVSGT